MRIVRRSETRTEGALLSLRRADEVEVYLRTERTATYAKATPKTAPSKHIASCPRSDRACSFDDIGGKYCYCIVYSICIAYIKRARRGRENDDGCDWGVTGTEKKKKSNSGERNAKSLNGFSFPIGNLILRFVLIRVLGSH